ncbi:unnamed protein product [Microthlaspi erraticum]|uniref:FKB95-like N-terminal Kelch domain-containing protein n=1 Tax=Microthlaspi erraticum TaxID=1685480 RepID=A0A6D2L5N8_9BRAS|nr:unnamed protein product [Microthlaspi erraticum]
MEFFDPKTRIWENAPSPGGEIRWRWTYISGIFALEGNLHVVGDKLHMNVVYKPKENKWDMVGFRKCLGLSSGSKSSCMIDNVTYTYTHEPSRRIEIRWYSKERSSGRAVKGLERLPKVPDDCGCVRLENYGGKLAVLWEENVRSFDSTSTKKKMVWCAVIAIERGNNVHEVFGKVEWCDVVVRVAKSCSLEHLIITTV